MHYIPYSRQDINEDDIKAVAEVLKSDFLTTGPTITRFEQDIKNFCQAENAIACSNGTAALHISLLAMEIGKGHLVWTSPISFVASANCALYVGAEIDFVDVNTSTGNIDPDILEEKLIQANKKNKLPDVLIVVHFAGSSCDMQRIKQLADKYNFKIIEDAAHALGAKYECGSYVGSCKYNDITTLSFHPVKSITTGEGGMITTNNNDIAKKTRLLVSHGITRDKASMQNEIHGGWYYEQQELGYNYRITDIQAALGVSQTKRLGSFIKRRLEIATIYNQNLVDIPLTLPELDTNSAWHLYIIRLTKEANISRLELYNKMHSANIGVNVHYIPIYNQPYYKKMGFEKGYCPNAEGFYKYCLSIPIFPIMTNVEQDYVIDKLKEFII